MFSIPDEHLETSLLDHEYVCSYTPIQKGGFCRGYDLSTTEANKLAISNISRT